MTLNALVNRNLKIRVIGWAFALTFLILGGVIIGTSLTIGRDIVQIKSAWEEFKESRSVRTQIVTALRAELGYGGMIHQFDNLILRRQVPLRQRSPRPVPTGQK